MAKANTEDRRLVLLHGSGDVLNRCVEDRGVTGTVGDEQTIVFVAGSLCEIRVPGADQDLNTSLEEASELVVLHADIDAQNTDSTAGRMFADDIRGRLV